MQKNYFSSENTKLVKLRVNNEPFLRIFLLYVIYRSRNEDNISHRSTRSDRRLSESKRSLSLIYPRSKHKQTNSTVMKLLSRVESLSVLFLKNFKSNATNQLIKKYATNKQIQKTPQFREILFDTIYNQILEDIVKLNLKQQQMYKLQTTLIEKSLQSLQLDKLTEHMMAFDRENELMQCIYLCDVVTVSNIDLELSAHIIEYARLKLNSILMKKDLVVGSDSEENEVGSGDDRTRARQSSINSMSQKNEEMRFEHELHTKLRLFIEASEMICAQFDGEATSSLTLVEFLSRFDGIYVGLNGSVNRNALFPSAKDSVAKYKSMARIAEDLSWSKQIFEDLRDSAENLDHENYFKIVNLLNEFINLNDNEDLIS